MTIILIISIIGIVFAVIGFITESKPIFVVGFLIVVFLAVIALGYCTCVTAPEWNCKKRAEAMGVECKYDVFAGCLVKYNGQWYPIDSRRVFE